LLESESYDTINLIHDADFEVMVSKDLYWVPVNTLGKPRYRNGDMQKFVSMTPEEKRSMKFNLYEAIQLLQICRLKEKLDVLKLEHNGTVWEHHRPGYFAVLTNYGCCSSIAAWLEYIIEFQYEQRGYVHFTRPDGTGHVLNFIFYHGFYYIVDLTAMLDDRAALCCKETGNKADFVKSKYVTGCCYKTGNLSNFVKFHSRIQKYHNFEFLYYRTAAMPYITPVSAKLFPDKHVEVLLVIETDVLNTVESIKVSFAEGPNYSPNWEYYNRLPD
jgi:hypothetical protein